MAVFPSPDSETDAPWCISAGPTAPLPTSLSPCWVHTPPERVNTQAAPLPLLSVRPPTMAVLASADRETEEPCSAGNGPTAPEPTSLGPCWVNCACTVAGSRPHTSITTGGTRRTSCENFIVAFCTTAASRCFTSSTTILPKASRGSRTAGSPPNASTGTVNLAGPTRLRRGVGVSSRGG